MPYIDFERLQFSLLFCMGRPRLPRLLLQIKITSTAKFPCRKILYETLGTDAIVTKLLTLYLLKKQSKKLIEKVTLNRAQG